MYTGGHTPVLHLSSGEVHPSPRLFLRAAALLALLTLIGLFGVWIHRTVQREAELSRYRSTMQDLAGTVRAMRSQAAAKRRAIRLSIDAPHGAFQVISAQRGSHRSYETLEQTLWLPDGLQIVEGPPVLTALPNGKLSSATVVIAAPAYQRLFRLTTRESGVVQLDEELTL